MLTIRYMRSFLYSTSLPRNLARAAALEPEHLPRPEPTQPTLLFYLFSGANTIPDVFAVQLVRL